MKISNNPVKYEVLVKQYMRSILDISGFPNNSPVPIYTPGWRKAPRELSVLPKNITQCPQPGLEPGPLAPESSALTI